MNSENLTPLQYIVLKIFKGKDTKPIPHKFGPYSEVLAKTVEELIDIGYLQKENNIIKITSKGEKSIEKIETTEKIKKLEENIDEIKDEFGDFNTEEILAFIYKSYPSYIEPSVKAEQIDYEKRFLELYEKGKLGISKIAELLGWNLDKTHKYIMEKSKKILIS
ncbi:MAG: hypothetical protein ACTSR3_05005 [Candidatus Helarchaeota archaeon]